MAELLAVECGACGWTGRRKPGRAVWCPKCGALAGFQVDLRDRDSDGLLVKAGDTISFSFGIPPRRVEGILFERDGQLIMPCEGVSPKEATLDMLRRYVGGFWKVGRLARDQYADDA